jgi:hypothetical protein
MLAPGKLSRMALIFVKIGPMGVNKVPSHFFEKNPLGVSFLTTPL